MPDAELEFKVELLTGVLDVFMISQRWSNDYDYRYGTFPSTGLISKLAHLAKGSQHTGGRTGKIWQKFLDGRHA